MISNADLDHFIERGGIRAQWNSLQEQSTGMFLVRKSGVEPFDKKATGGACAEIKMFELGIDYDVEMVRYMLAQRSYKKVTTSRSIQLELAQKTIQMWATVITAEKNWQMAARNARVPDKTHLPWCINNIYEMPVVVWLRKQSDGTQSNNKRGTCAAYVIAFVGVDAA